MSQAFELRKPTTTFEHESTLVAALELSGKSWLISAALPGIERRPKKTVRVGDIDAVMAILSGWREAAARAGKDVTRVVVSYEAGRDGFWIARELIALGIEVYVMQAASIGLPVVLEQKTSILSNYHYLESPKSCLRQYRYTFSISEKRYAPISAILARICAPIYFRSRLNEMPLTDKFL